MYRKLVTVFLLVFFMLGNFSCGGSYSNKTQTELVIDAIIPQYLDNDTDDVDVFQDRCGTQDSWKPEVFKKHTAKVLLENRLLPGVEDTSGAGWIKVNRYIVRYTPDSDNLPALDPIDFYSTELKINPGEQGTFIIDIFPINKKIDFASKMGYFNSVVQYDASVEIWGETEYGDPVNVNGVVTLTLGDFNNCSE